MRQEPFVSLMKSFLDQKIQAQTFCTRFIKLWAQERDITYAKKAEWPQPYDEMLTAAWQRGEINDVQFREKDAELWGYEPHSQDVIDAVHSACDCWRLVPNSVWEIDEAQLRHEVQEAFTALTQANKSLPEAILQAA